MTEHEHSLRELAYRLWEEAGCPEGRAEEFWYTALEVLTSETRPPAEPDEALPAEAAAPAPEAAPQPSADAAEETPKPKPRKKP